VSLVNVLFTVSDRNKKFISNLAQQDFEVLEDGVPQQIQYFSNFSKTGDVPLTIALLIDTSGSVKDKLQLEIETASEFLRSVLRPNKDLALLMQFSSEVELVQDFTDNVARLEKALDTLRAGGGTSLYDAIFLAVSDKLKSEAGRKIIVILSDGEDNQSKVQKQEAIVAAQKADVLIYGIGVRSDFGVNFGVMKEFARETGGRFFLAKVQFSELEESFKEIKRDLQNQYGLAYSSTNTKQDGTFRRIEVRCKNKALVVKARTGYYAPQEEKPSRS
jgi:VWFA-related protein